MKVATILFKLGITLLLSLSLISCFKWNNPVDSEFILSPQLSHEAGTYHNPINLSFTNSDMHKMKIYYTLDGSLPNSSSILYSSPISLENNATLKAIAIADQNESETITANYVFRVADPVFSVEGGTYTDAQTILISCVTNGATIRYTTDGSEPIESSTLYSTAIQLTTDTTLKAKALKANWNASQVAEAVYEIDTVPTNFVLVSGGTFNNGTSNVTVSSFYMDKYELTQVGYHAVMGTNPAIGYGVGNNYPVYFVSWYNAIEYCNRRSMNEGLTPCYSYSSFGTDPVTWPAGWNTLFTNHTNVSCDWSANGYRLPTEMEWMFAAMGGNLSQGYTYSGSNTIGNVAWYSSNSGNSTRTVGTKAANELGLYDLSGNVWEWVWDVFGDYPSTLQFNPTGANSGSHRVMRAGGWGSGANSCTVSFRGNVNATDSYYGIGFRCVRKVP